jgi:UPF0716 protein FxsA
MWVFALILAVPLIEIGLFVTLGGALGLWATLALVVGSFFLGISILRRGGVRPQKIRRDMPIVHLAEGGFAMLAAILLILPGFLTSALGLLLLVPRVQRLVIERLGRHLAARGFSVHAAHAHRDEVVEGEFTVVERPRDEGLPPSRWTRH